MDDARVIHLHVLHRIAAEQPAISHLTACLRVEGRAVEHERGSPAPGRVPNHPPRELMQEGIGEVETFGGGHDTGRDNT
jgi:hypothetical protein